MTRYEVDELSPAKATPATSAVPSPGHWNSLSVPSSVRISSRFRWSFRQFYYQFHPISKNLSVYMRVNMFTLLILLTVNMCKHYWTWIYISLHLLNTQRIWKILKVYWWIFEKPSFVENPAPWALLHHMTELLWRWMVANDGEWRWTIVNDRGSWWPMIWAMVHDGKWWKSLIVKDWLMVKCW